MQQTIPVNDRIIATHVGLTPSSGPFTVDFPFFSLNDVVVTWLPDGGDVATTLVRGADYDLVGVATEDGSFSSGTITLVLPYSNGILSRFGDTTIERLSNFPLQGFFSRLALNAELNRITVVLQEHDGTIRIARTDLESSLHIPLSEADDGLITVAAAKAVRANKILAWDALGNLTHSTKDLDQLDNIDVDYFDARYVNITGDSMSGPLTVPFVTANQATINTSLQVMPGATANVPTPAQNDVSTKVPTTAWVVGFLGAQGQGEAVYKFGDSTVSGDPGTGYLDIQAGVGIARTISMSRLDADGVSRFLTAMKAGDAIVVTNELTPVTAYARYTLTSDVTDNSTWVQFSANLNDSSNPLEAPPHNTRLRVTGFLNTMNGGAAISGVSAGYGLLGGGSSGVIPLSVDTTIVAELSDLNAYLPKANPAFTGTLTGPTATFSGQITAAGSIVTGAAGAYRSFFLQTSGSQRWALSENNAAETGSDAGSDFSIVSYTDAGAFKAFPLTINRATSAVTLTGTLTGTLGTFTGTVKAHSGTALPAGGTLGAGVLMSSTPNFGLTFGTGVPDKAMARGSLYLRGDGAATPYYNTDGTGAGWVAVGSGGGAAVWVGTTPPPVPTDGQLWYYTDASVGGGTLYIRYNDSFGTPQWVPASPAVGGQTVLQTVSFQTGAVSFNTAIIPLDDTIPQITEGTEFLTCAITPRSAASRLMFDINLTGGNSQAGAVSVALFQDAIAGALASSFNMTPIANGPVNLALKHSMISGSTAPMTFRVRAGPQAGGATYTLNGTSSARLHGGSASSSIVIQEVL